MFACRSNTRARTKPDTTLANILTLGLFFATLLLPFHDAFGQTSGKTLSKAAADSATKADEEGFTVRVVEETKTVGGKTVKVRVETKTTGSDAVAGKRSGTAKIVDVPDIPEAPDAPEPPDVSDANSNDLVRFGQDIEIPAGKVIDGDVVAIGGSVTVRGRVKGDCVAVGGSVSLKDGGVVEGDATSIGGVTSTGDSAKVGGSDVSVGGWPLHGEHARGFLPLLGLMGFGAVAGVIGLLIQFVLTLLFAWLCLLLFKERMAHAAERMGHQMGRSFLWGLVAWMGMIISIPVLVVVGVVAVVLLCITLIGIPIAILLAIALVFAIIGVVLGIIVATFVGYLNGAMYLGRRLLGRYGAGSVSPFKAIFFGVLLIMGLHALGELCGFLGVVFLMPIGIAFGIASGLLAFVLTTAGLGAMVLTRFAKGHDTAPGAAGMGAGWPPPPSTVPPVPPAPQTPDPPGAKPQEGGTSDAP